MLGWKRGTVRRRTVVASLAAGAAGLSLTIAGALPSTAASGAAPAPSLRQLLHAPAAGQDTDRPAEEMAAQQAFAAKHYGNFGLADPRVLSIAIQRGVTQAARVATSSKYGKRWHIRGPVNYYANNPQISGNLTGLGFQNLSGRVTSIATTNQRPDLVWAGTAGGGVWRSTDDGAHWKPMFDHQGVMAIGSVAIDPRDPDRVFVGTGEPNTNADAYYGNGMYVTDDGGKTWHHRHLSGVLTVFHVEAAPPSPGYPDGRVFAATNHGLWLSTDHGRHYRNVALPTNATHNGIYTKTAFGNFVTDVRVRPHHANEVVAVVGWRRGDHPEPNGTPDSVGNGFYQSTKSGAVGSWKFVPQDPVTGLGVPGNNANTATGSSASIGRTSLAYSADGKYLWAVVQDAGNFNGELYLGLPLPASNSVLNGVYVSTTASPGKNWVPKANAQTLGGSPGSGLLVEQAALYGPGVQSWYDQWIAVDPNDDNRVLLGLEEVYEAVANQYAPGMASWRTVSRYWNGCALLSAVDCSNVPGPVYAGKTTHPDQHAVAFVTRQGSTATKLYTGSDGGVFSQNSHVTDLGYTGYDNSSWHWLNLGLATTQPYYAVEGSDGTIYAGLQDNGEVKIAPGSTRGDEIAGGDGFDTAVVPGNSNVVYEEYTYGDVMVSTDGGHNDFSDISSCEVGPDTAQFATPFMLDPKNPNHLVVVGRYVDESTAGQNTVAGSTEEGECVNPGSWKVAYDLGASPVANSPGVSGGGVNNVATAVTVNGARMYVPFCGLCDPISQGSGKWSYFHSGIATNVKPGCTPVVGASNCWHKAKAIGLPQRYAQGVAMDPVHPNTVYVTLSGYLRRWIPNGNNSGPIYVSHDGGNHFHNISGNLPRVPGNSVLVRNGRLFVATDRGVYTAIENTAHPKRTHWTRVGTRLPNASVLDLRMNPNGSQLVAATHGRGVWTYSFGSKAKPAYRQHAATSTPPARPAPTTPDSPPPAMTIDPGLVGSGLGLLLLALALPLWAGRRTTGVQLA